MARRERATPRRSGAWRVADAALTVASIGGVLCVAAVVAATFFDITLIMFKTGSMSPTIPARSLAVVRQIDAADARVGDIVTVDRPGELPITHRVTSTTDVGGGLSSITMRGDANADEDPAPYVVNSVRIVLYSVPGLASAVIAVSNPYVMGSITLGAAALVTWAFWPRGSRSRHRGGRRRGDRERDDAGRVPRATGITGAAVIVAVFVYAPLVSPAPAHAAEIETVVRGQYLTLRSINDPTAMQSMTPGRPVPWQVGVSVAAPEPGLVHVGISAEGGLVNPGALDLQIRACSQRWVGGVCATGGSLWLPLQDITVASVPTEANGVRELDTVDSDVTTWLMIDVVMPVQAEPGATATLNIHAWGEDMRSAMGGDDGSGPAQFDAVQIGGSATARLASTGASVGSSVALAFGAVLLGLVLAAAARLVRGSSDDAGVTPSEPVVVGGRS